jgi:glycosyltransferase involved in cell wall biosynthesis
MKLTPSRVIKGLRRRWYQYLAAKKQVSITFDQHDKQINLPGTLPDGKPWPKISIVTPSYNQGRYIEETILSVLDQGYPNLEYIIIDGGSTDSTVDVLNRYKMQLAYVVSEADRGQSHAINKGFAIASGEFVSWLNSDDRLAPGALAAVALAFSTSSADMVSGICEIYKNDVLINRHMTACGDGPLPLLDILDLDNGWNAGQFFYQPEVFFSKALWDKAGGQVREDLYYSMDYELWLRFANCGANIHVIGRPLARFRVHSDQKTADPSRFKAELIVVRDQFAAEVGIKLDGSQRPAVNFSRHLKVAMINDHGGEFGAGIAHARIASGFGMAGHEVKLFILKGYANQQKIVSDIEKYQPDVVFFGNIHGANPQSLELLRKITKNFPTYWVLHDFWLLTGRCTYPGECENYLSGCDASCGTYKEYPALKPDKIAGAWKDKFLCFELDEAPILLANSLWTAQLARKAMSSCHPSSSSPVEKIRLGVPTTEIFRPLDKCLSREAIGIALDKFVIVFSSTTLGDQRKGGDLLVKAISRLNLPDLELIILGYADVKLDIEGIKTTYMGYVTDPAILAATYSAADVHVGPSTEETLGQSFLEAAACGIPSIGFGMTGVRDAVIPGITGYWAEQISAASLEETILCAYHDRTRLKDMRVWSRLYAENEWSIEASHHSIFSVLRKTGCIDLAKVPHRINYSYPLRLYSPGSKGKSEK